MTRGRKLLLGGAVILAIVGLATFIPRAASISSTIWQVVTLSSIPSGASVDSTVHQVVCLDPVALTPVACSGATAAPTQTPGPTQTQTPTPAPTLAIVSGQKAANGTLVNPTNAAPVSQANGGWGALDEEGTIAQGGSATCGTAAAAPWVSCHFTVASGSNAFTMANPTNLCTNCEVFIAWSTVTSGNPTITWGTHFFAFSPGTATVVAIQGSAGNPSFLFYTATAGQEVVSRWWSDGTNLILDMGPQSVRGDNYYASGSYNLGSSSLNQHTLVMTGSGSGSATLGPAAAAGTPTIILPTVNTTEVTAEPGTSGMALVSTAAGVRSFLATEAHLGNAGGYGNATNFPTGNIVVQAVATNAGHFTQLTSNNQSLNAGSCSTAPTFNVFDGASNTGTAKIASVTAQVTRGTTTQQTETLTFAAGDVIGIYVSTQGATCLAPTFSVDATVTYP